MKIRGSDIVVKALEDEGISFTFGIPGTHNIELYDSLSRSKSVQPILVTDEQSASFMADGVFRSSNTIGVVNVVPGAGLTHALSGIAEAYMDGVALLVLACGVRTDTGKAFQLHDVDQLEIVRPVTKAQFQVKHGSEIYAVIRHACQIARSSPAGPVAVEIPANHYVFYHEPNFDANIDNIPSVSVPNLDDLDRVCALLEKSRRPLLYLGLGAVGTGKDLIALAERLEAPVATTIQGKGVFPETHPLWLWCGFGNMAPTFIRKVVKDCDMTLAIGCRFAEVGTGSYGLEPPGLFVHVDIDPCVFNQNYSAELTITADAAAFVPALLNRLSSPRQVDEDLRNTILRGHTQVVTDWEASARDKLVAPFHLFKTLQKLLGPDAIYTTDSGNGTFLAAECLRLERPYSFLAPVDYSCMGYAIPAAMGAAFVCQNRPVVAFAGDGAFLMTGLELLTAAENQLPVIVFVLRDGELAQIAQFQQTALGQKTCSVLPDYDLSALCRGMSVEHLLLNTNSDIEPVLKKAVFAAKKKYPIVVEVEVDYSQKTYFTQGVIRTNFSRLPWADRLRFIARVLKRKGLRR